MKTIKEAILFILFESSVFICVHLWLKPLSKLNFAFA
jgi:hypothetical protein